MSPEQSYSGEATIAQGELRAKVQCGFHIAENPMAQMKEWRGWYKGSHELAPGDAHLQVGSGDWAAINITRAMQADGQGTFMGAGDPPIIG